MTSLPNGPAFPSPGAGAHPLHDALPLPLDAILGTDAVGFAPTPISPGAEPAQSLLRVVGPSGALDVWLGGPGDRATLEADVREVSERGLRRLPALAVALGDVARRHKLEVRVIPRLDANGPSVLVLFGRRTFRAKSR